ncbi:antitoxin [bacterium]|nr:antitoxin [bacterium]
MKTLTIRGLDEPLTRALKARARNQQESMNKTILKLLRKSVGLSDKPIFQTYDDLNNLAGTWTVNEEKAFYSNTDDFNKIDPEMWT